jgi:hypothetical protein
VNNRNLVRAAYVAAFILILIPIFDASALLLPLRFGEVKWRYGSVGLLANAMMMPIAGLLLAFFVANALDHRKVLRTLGVLAWLGVAGAVVCLISFGLDALQARVEVNPTQHSAFLLATATTMGKLLFGGAILALLGAAGLKRFPLPATRTERVPLIGEARATERV